MAKPKTPRGQRASLQARLADRDNNFDVLRLVAAALVLISHGFLLTGNDDPFVAFTDESGLGGPGVLIFFALSGFLVAQSWLKDPRVVPFFVKRALRLLPALVVVLLLTAYVLAPLLTSADRGGYVTSLGPAKYVVVTSLMLSNRSIPGRLTTGPPGSLEGVFDDNPLDTTNGSLWTLPLEATAYALVALAGLLGILWRRPGPRSGHLALLAFLLVCGGAALKVGGEAAYPFFAAFAGGAILYLLRARLPLRAPLFFLAVTVWVGAYTLPVVPEALVLGLIVPYVVVFLGLHWLDRLRVLTRPGDVSYGLYIYAWPVTQCVVDLTGTRNPAVGIAVSAVITYAAALLSWRLVERPALALKGRLAAPAAASSAPSGTPATGQPAP